MKKDKSVHSVLFKCFLVFFTGILVSCICIILLQYFHLEMNWELTWNFFDEYTRFSILQTSIIFILYLWFFFLLNSKLLSSVMIIAGSLLLGISSSQKLLYRGEPVYPSDIYFLKDASFFLDMLNPRIIILIVSALVGVGAAFILFFKKRDKKLSSNRWLRVVRITGLFLTSIALFEVYHFNQPGNRVKAAFNEYAQWITYSQEENYTQNGMVSGLLYNLKSPALNKPEDYSKERIEEIYHKYAEQAEAINEERQGSLEDTNVLFVMNETFSDAHRLEGLSITGGDTLADYRKLPGIHGQTLSQAYGGGTANIEFEALTGISLEPLNGNVSIPFIHLSQQMKTLPNITNFITQYPHELTAIHPHNTTMYKRLDNYVAMGFENLIFAENMVHADKIDRSPYISDEASYEELLMVMEETENKDFIHLVTMQNHMSYEGKYDDVQYKVTGTEKTAEVEYYLKGMEYSNQAIVDLIETFENYDEKVLLVFWGDHLPAIYDDGIKELNGHQLMHETPLLIYSNFTKNSGSIGTISPIYFINHVMEITGTKITPYVALLEKMEKALPAFEKTFYLERETGIKEKRRELRPSTQILLKEYDLILYDITTGENYSKQLGFY